MRPITRPNGWCRGSTLALTCAAGLLAWVAAAAQAPQLLDRVLAVVSGSVVTLSDARLVVDLGLVDVPRGRDPVAVALTWLIERRLVLDEATRYEAGVEDEIGVEAMLTLVRRRFPTEASWESAKRRLGQTDETIRAFVAETFSAQEFVERRFGTQPPPSDADLLAYFEQHRKEFAQATAPPAFEDARERVEARVRAERKARAITEWLTRLRRRADVSELYTPAR